ncbi:MAG: FKBP-type peptidyl-prolyl cis-trans isomerase [Bacteroidota bacterium]|nr:FKBP-type peptidyl-prolyl cis-trans isomerase [Bacteroidota bacterium]
MVVCAGIAFSPLSAQKKAASKAAKTELKTQKDKLSYTIGTNIGENFKKQGIDVDAKFLLKGITDGLEGKKYLLTDDEMKQVMMALQKKMIAKQSKEFAKIAETNKKTSEDFLAANKTKDSVVTMPDGLQYKILREGTGKMPTKSDTVVVNYQGRLIDGTVFDDSYQRGEPVTFPLGGVIPGWIEALQLMKEGSKWELYIPSELAYGERGAGQHIGPNEALIFDVELLKVK